MKGPYPYFGPTGILDHIDHFRIDCEFAIIGEDGDHFLKHKEKEMTLIFSGKANVNNHAHIIIDSNLCLARWFHLYFIHRDLTAHLTRQGAKRYKLTKAGLEKLPILLPPVSEQNKITKILSVWDQAITTTETLLGNSQQQKKALMQLLLTGRKRLSGFNIPWRKLPLTRYLLGSSLRNSGLTQGANEIMSVNKSEGMTPMRAETIGKSIERYKVVKPGWFAYNPMRINVGSICRWAGKNDCLVSPDYVVFSCDEELLLGSYFDHFRQAEPWINFMRNAGNGSVRVRIYLDDLSLLKIPLPTLEEQEKIAAVLTTAEQEIKTLQTKLACLKQEKKALMQHLLTGKRRVKLDELEVA
ncbi:Type I restriction-modification system, specificity subunit S [Pseudomonas chlororaphis subsp. aureofaciens]|nr:Type I restriction-modification system, specificity subunit S [Pseudomonas chlororaphis subsp. aureofaciens]